MRSFALAMLLAMLATENAFGHDVDPHPLVDNMAGKWERDSILSDHLGAVDDLFEGISTLVFRNEHSLESRERIFRDDDTRSIQLLHVGRVNFSPTVVVVYALRTRDGIYELGTNGTSKGDSGTVQNSWLPVHLVRADKPQADLLILGTTAFHRTQ